MKYLWGFVNSIAEMFVVAYSRCLRETSCCRIFVQAFAFWHDPCHDRLTGIKNVLRNEQLVSTKIAESVNDVFCVA
jgi:hypothetical protein